MGKLKLTYFKSSIGYQQRQKDTVRSLGLRRLNQTVIREDTPVVRGMIDAVRHLVRTESVEE